MRCCDWNGRCGCRRALRRATPGVDLAYQTHALDCRAERRAYGASRAQLPRASRTTSAVLAPAPVELVELQNPNRPQHATRSCGVGVAGPRRAIHDVLARLDSCSVQVSSVPSTRARCRPARRLRHILRLSRQFSSNAEAPSHGAAHELAKQLYGSHFNRADVSGSGTRAHRRATPCDYRLGWAVV